MPGFVPPGFVPPGQPLQELVEEDAIFAPFIGATTTVYSPGVQSEGIVDAPFIASATTVYTPGIFSSGGNARISQLPVESVVLPDNSQARVSQLAVEAVISVPSVTLFQALIITTPPRDAPG